MAKYYLDFKYNGRSGALITMALLKEDNTLLYVGFKDSKTGKKIDPWVAHNVLPVVNAGPIPIRWLTDDEIRQAIRKMLSNDPAIEIYTDWPSDIEYFCGLLVIGDGSKLLASMSEINRITFHFERVDAYPTEVTNAVQHNAAWDAMALRHKLHPPI